MLLISLVGSLALAVCTARAAVLAVRAARLESIEQRETERCIRDLERALKQARRAKKLQRRTLEHQAIIRGDLASIDALMTTNATSHGLNANAGDTIIIQAKHWHKPSWRHRVGRQVARSSAQGITGLAAFLAGRKRSGLRDEWRSHLAGDVGCDLPIGQRVQAAVGFVVAAVRYRLQDAADLGWVVVDAILKSRRLSNTVVFVPTGLAALIILRHEGAVGLVGNAESVVAIGGSLYMLVKVGRWWRDVKPPEPKAQRAKK